MNREEIQLKSVELARTNNVLLLLSVRLGKTKAALDISRLFGRKHLIVTSEILIIDGIQKEIVKFGFNLEDYTVICYDSLHNFTDTVWDTIILDEVEHLTELRLSYLQTLECKRWVGLCAKMSRDKKSLLKQLFKFKEYKVTYNEAVRMGILAKPKIYIISIPLDNRLSIYNYEKKLKKYTTTLDIKYEDRYTHYNQPYNLSIKCNALQYYKMLEEDIKYKKSIFIKQRQEHQKIAWLKAGGLRKQWLSNYKEGVGKEIIQWMQSRKVRFMCFLANIAQCERLGSGRGVTHSKNNNKQAIELFNNLEVDEIYVVDQGREGTTVDGIEEGLCIQASGSDTKNYQTIGRIAIGASPTTYVLQVKDTRDTDYIDKIRADIDSSYIVDISWEEFKTKIMKI